MVCVACNKPAAEVRTEHPVCGGYTDFRALDPDDVALFDSVYTAEPALTPYAVATQVVAGTNYRFLCRDAKKTEYMVTIFVPLACYADSQQTKVTSVEVIKK